MATPARILIVRLSHLGDVVHALPVYHALRAAHPRARIGWAVQPEFAALVEGLAGLEDAFVFERRGGLRAWPRLWSRLRAFAPDWTIDAQGNTKSALVTLGSGAPRRSGLARRDWAEPFGAAVLTDAAEPAPPGGHALERTRALVRHVAPHAPWRPDPGLAAHELVLGDELADRWLGRGGDAAILHLAPPGDVRSWPAARFGELARELAARGRAVLVLSGPAERELGAQLEQRVAGPRVRHWVGQRDLRALAAFLRAASARGATFVGCDSGPLHLAVACGLRTICLAGPQDPLRTGPWPLGGEAGHRAVTASPAPSCAPCLSRRCRHPRGPVCLDELRASDVAAALP